MGDPYVRGFDNRWFEVPGEAGKEYVLLTVGDSTVLIAEFGPGGLKGQATFVNAIRFSRGPARMRAVLQKRGGKWVMLGALGGGAGPAHGVGSRCQRHLQALAGCRHIEVPACLPAVSANGKPLGATDSVALPGGIVVQVSRDVRCQSTWCHSNRPTALHGRAAYASSPAPTPRLPHLQTFPNFRGTKRPMVVISAGNLKVEAKQRKPLKPGQLADPLYGEWLDVFISVLDPLPPPVMGLIGACHPCCMHACVCGRMGLPCATLPPANPLTCPRRLRPLSPPSGQTYRNVPLDRVAALGDTEMPDHLSGALMFAPEG